MEDMFQNLRLTKKGTRRFVGRWIVLSILVLVVADEFLREAALQFGRSILFYQLSTILWLGLFAYMSSYMQHDSIPRPRDGQE